MENSCLKKHKPSPKKWILASSYPEFRRHLRLIPANAGLFHYAGNNPVRYIDPDGRMPHDFFANAINDLSPSNRFGFNSMAKMGVFPNETVGFTFDPDERVYHATYDCWQKSFGYNKLYDWGFNLATDMKASEFKFSSGGKVYKLWGWKGDYLNMGAGCELGIYRQDDGLKGMLGHFVADPDNLSMSITASLFLDGKKIGSFDPAKFGKDGKHWWPGIFNPFEQNKKASHLKAQFNVTFNDSQMYQDFYSEFKNDSRASNWNNDTNSVTLTF